MSALVANAFTAGTSIILSPNMEWIADTMTTSTSYTNNLRYIHIYSLINQKRNCCGIRGFDIEPEGCGYTHIRTSFIHNIPIIHINPIIDTRSF